MKGYGSELEKKLVMVIMMRNDDDDDDDYDDEVSDEVGGDLKLSNSQKPKLSNFETLKLKLLSCWGHRNRHTQEDDWHNGQTSQIETVKLLGTYKCAHTRI